MIKEELEKTIRTIPNFPKKGIMFKDITPVLMKPTLCQKVAEDIAKQFKKYEIDAVVGVESRGFLFGMLIAQLLNVPFITVRKKGKLPYKTHNYSYDLEYGSSEVEIHIDALQPKSRVLIHDDLLATGGTAKAAAELVLKSQATVVGFTFLVELLALGGQRVLTNYTQNIYSITTY